MGREGWTKGGRLGRVGRRQEGGGEPGERARGEGCRIPERRRPVCGTPARSVESRRLRHNPIPSSFSNRSLGPGPSRWFRPPAPSVPSHESAFSVFAAIGHPYLARQSAASFSEKSLFVQAAAPTVRPPPADDAAALSGLVRLVGHVSLTPRSRNSLPPGPASPSVS